MKRNILIFLCLIISIITFGQEKKQYLGEIKGVIVSPPIFSGIEEVPVILKEEVTGSLNNYLIKHIQYPEESKEMFARGTEVIRFVVSPTGEVSDFIIINSVSQEIDKETIRVLRTTNKKWKPGTNNGKPVAMEKEVSIVFNINMNDDTPNTTNFVAIARKNFIKGSKLFFMEESNKRALKYFDKAICYLPNDRCLLVTRGMCRYELGDKKGAYQDWNRIKRLGGSESDVYIENLSDFKGYTDLVCILQGKKKL